MRKHEAHVGWSVEIRLSHKAQHLWNIGYCYGCRRLFVWSMPERRFVSLSNQGYWTMLYVGSQSAAQYVNW